MHSMKNGVRCELTADEEAEFLANGACEAEAKTARDDAKAAKLALCALRLADVPADADLGQLRAIVQCLIEQVRGD